MTTTHRSFIFVSKHNADRKPPLVSEQEMMEKKLQFWTERKKPRPPRFFLTDAERKDKETLRIQHWLDLADMALGQTAETDCDESFRPLRKLV